VNKDGNERTKAEGRKNGGKERREGEEKNIGVKME